MSPSLNLDILLDILSLASRDTVIAMMLTCRSLHAEALKVILHTVYLKHSQSASNFICLVGARPLRDDVASRYHLVRGLEFSNTFIVNDPLLPTFLSILRRLTRLESISMVECEDCFYNHPGLARAIESLPSLSRLNLSAVGYRTCDMLGALTATRLTSVSLDFFQGGYEECGFFDHEDPSDAGPYNPIVFLSRWSSSLQEIRAVDWRTVVKYAPAIHVFPNVRRLELLSHGTLEMLSYIHIFPNVAHLSVRSIEDDLAEDEGWNYDALKELHRARIERQLSSRASWTRLEELSGSIQHVYGLSPTYSVARVRIDRFHGAAEQRRLFTMLAEILQYTRPKHLAIDGDDGLLALEDDEDGSPHGKLASVLGTPGAEHIERLEIHVDLGNPAQITVNVARSLVSFSRLRECAPPSASYALFDDLFYRLAYTWRCAIAPPASPPPSRDVGRVHAGCA